MNVNNWGPFVASPFAAEADQVRYCNYFFNIIFEQMKGPLSFILQPSNSFFSVIVLRIMIF